MRVTKKAIVDGLAAYILEQIIPKMGRNTNQKIILTVAAKMAQTQDALVNKLFDSPWAVALLPPDEKGLYEIGPLFDEIEAAVKACGELPLTLPAIPIIAPEGGTLTLYPEDVAAIREKIGGETHA